MKKLKTILQSNIIFLFLIIFLFVYIFYMVNYHEVKSKYNLNDKEIYGYIYEKNIDGNKLTLKLRAKENIIIYYYFKTEKEKIEFNLKYGDYIYCYGKINMINQNTNFNLFNYKKYLLSKKIYYTFTASSIDKINESNKMIYIIKNIINKKIEKCNLSKAYITAFVLGEKNYIDYEYISNYQKLGIIHLFCISGMHVSFFVIFLNKIFRKTKLGNAFIILFLLLYIFITTFQISIIRSVVYYFFSILKNKYPNLNFNKFFILFISILLFVNPFYIYNSGFLFSFIISFFILYYSKIINTKKIKSVYTSIISFFSSLPIVVNSYFEINFFGIIMNIIFIPIVTYVLFPLGILTFLFPTIDKYYIYLIQLFQNIISLISRLNIFRIYVPKIPLFLIIIYYIILALIIKNKKFILIELILIIIFIFNGYYVLNPKIYFVDVSQGDSILIRIKNKNILIDTGGTYNYRVEDWKKKNKEYNLNDYVLSPFFKSIGVKKFNYMILSHGDYDHMGEAINLINNFKVEKVIFNCGEFNNLENELIKVLDRKKIKYYSCIKELTIENNKLYFLQTKELDNENDNSNVIYTKLNNYKFLFMGDAGIKKENDILDKYNLLDIDVLKVGHHGSKTSSSKDFIDEINPKYSIISVGKNNRYGHPNKEVLNNLEDSQIYRTDQNGSIMFKIKNSKLEIETCIP